MLLLNRQQRKKDQFLLNFAGLRDKYSMPTIDVTDVMTDRVIYRRDDEWIHWLKAHCADWDFKIRKHNPLHSKTPTAIQGWREKNVPFIAGQWILHTASDYGSVIEFDFDLCNPNEGALPAFGHLLEWAWHRIHTLIGKLKTTTNPFRVRRLLAKYRGIFVKKVTG